MASANDPPASSMPQEISPPPAEATGIQATPPRPVDSDTIPLPPPEPQPRRPLTVEELGNLVTRLDKGMVAVVLVLAFFLASFVARNSDFWMHLASGRLLAKGHYSFGVDPYAYTTENVYWVNHAWLFDLLIYGLSAAFGGVETAAGGAALVVFKALLVTGLAGLLLLLRRPGQGLWIPAACTGLALLALSPRLLLQPAVFSLLFLGLTLWLLTQLPRRKQAAQTFDRSFILHLSCFLLLFILWVNVDQWFFLGPLTVGLYLLGDLLQEYFTPLREDPDPHDSTDRLRLLGILLAGLAACLVNPHGWRAFVLPWEFPYAEPALTLRQDPRFQLFFQAPWQWDYLRSSGALSVAGIAYYVLVVAGLVSFWLNRHNLRWWRCVIWFVFCLLTTIQLRAVPFFAVVAGPITALNLQDFAAQRFGTALRVDRRWKQWSLGGRIVTLVVGVGLLLAAWPGWLQAHPFHTYLARRVAWNVEPDPSWKQAAQTLREWRQQGKLTAEDFGLNLSPDLVSYCAWFCADDEGRPLEKGYFDNRFRLFRGLVPSYLRARQVLRADLESDQAELFDPWLQTMQQLQDRDRTVSHIVLSGDDVGNKQLALALLVSKPDHWPLLYADGRTWIFGRADLDDSDAADRVKALRLDFNQLAFGPRPEQAPPQGPDWSQSKWGWSAWWDWYASGPPPQSLDTHQARMYLHYFEYTGFPHREAQLTSWQTSQTRLVVSILGLAAGDGGVSGSGLLAYRLQGLFVEYGPPALPLLALRAARRAVAANPQDAAPYARLAQAYDSLWGKLEAPRGGWQPFQSLIDLHRLRHVQVVAATRRALALGPEPAVAEQLHFLLARYYSAGQRITLPGADLSAHYLDLALESLEERIKVLRQHESELTVTADQLAALEEERNKFESELQKWRDQYEVGAANKPLPHRVGLALQSGLIKEALKLLKENGAETAKNDQLLNLFIFLLLTTGEVEELSSGLSQEWKGRLGEGYHYYSGLAAAATGDYAKARDHFDQMAQGVVQIGRGPLSFVTRASTAVAFSRSPTSAFAQLAVLSNPKHNPNLVQELVGTRQLLVQQAEFNVLCGLLALEEGVNDKAAEYFETALFPKGPSVPFASFRVAFHYFTLLKTYGK